MATRNRTRAVDPDLLVSRMFAQVFQMYMECSEETQGVIREMVEIVNGSDPDEDYRSLALVTISEILFPPRFDDEEYDSC